MKFLIQICHVFIWAYKIIDLSNNDIGHQSAFSILDRLMELGCPPNLQKIILDGNSSIKPELPPIIDLALAAGRLYHNIRQTIVRPDGEVVEYYTTKKKKSTEKDSDAEDEKEESALSHFKRIMGMCDDR